MESDYRRPQDASQLQCERFRVTINSPIRCPNGESRLIGSDIGLTMAALLGPGGREGDMSAVWRGRIVLGCIVACLVVAASSTPPASAGCISQTFGSTTIHNCDGKISTSYTIGATRVHNFDGKLGTSQTVGNTTVHNLGNKLGTSHTVGTTTMHNFDGKFGWSQRFGNTVVHSGALFTDR